MQNNWKRVLFVSLVVGGILSLFASSSPDGLEKIAEAQGFLAQGKHLVSGLFPDYQVSSIHNEGLASSLSGIIGTLLVFGTLFFIGKILYRSRLKAD